MKVPRALFLLVVLVLVAYGTYRLLEHRRQPTSVAVYYVVPATGKLASWNVSIAGSVAKVPHDRAFYAAAQAVVGPPPGTQAVRFPAGTVVRGVALAGDLATVNLAGAIASPQQGSLGEDGEFRSLVWTLTSLPGIRRVQVEVDGVKVAALPGGHLELDEPLSRQSW